MPDQREQLRAADAHRRPGKESLGLYPGLVVSDGEHSRVTGSITVGRSRLPLWAFIHEVVSFGWSAGTDDYYSEEDEERFGVNDAATFFHCLMQLRGEFGRLLLVLADAERLHRQGGWLATRRHRRRIAMQLRRCLDKLEAVDVR